MNNILVDWIPGETYKELSVIRFFDEGKLLTDPYKLNPGLVRPTSMNEYKSNAIPVYPKVVRNRISSVDNSEFIEKLMDELPDLTLDTLQAWKKL